MGKNLQLRFWGVRGSCASPGAGTAEVGGNTSCVELRSGDERLIFDGGTGLRVLGDSLAGEAVSASILFSHVHWDHIQGVPFFAPLFRPDTELTIYGGPEEGSIESALRGQMTGPNFPVTLSQAPCALQFREVHPGATFSVGSFRVRSAALNHPNGVLAYRAELGGCAVVYATDTEHYDGGRLDSRLVELAAGADVLIYDSQYTPEEYDGAGGGCCRVGWGHSTWREGVRVARAAGVKQLVLFHHDPSHDDQAIARIEAAASDALPGTVAAREGLIVNLERCAPLVTRRAPTCA